MAASSSPMFIISDGTGHTAERVVRAALMQFPQRQSELRVFPHITEPDQLDRIMPEAARQSALVVTTLIHPDMRARVRDLANENRVTAVDLIGNLLNSMGRHLDTQPAQRPGILHEADDAYYSRIDALVFAVNSDDGRHLDDLHQADIVLIGVAGTSKTPLAVHMANLGYRVANLPIRAGHPLPKGLDLVDPARIFALTVDPAHLVQRLQATDPDRGARLLVEVEWAEGVLARHPAWPVIDVTGRSVEAVAATIVKIMQEQGTERQPQA